jgi:hypothetical protein
MMGVLSISGEVVFAVLALFVINVVFLPVYTLQGEKSMKTEGRLHETCVEACARSCYARCTIFLHDNPSRLALDSSKEAVGDCFIIGRFLEDRRGIL